MSLTIGPATDYLFSLAQQAVAGVIVFGRPMVAVDGIPEELAPGMFVVGLTEPPSDAGVDATTQGAGLVLQTMGTGGLQFAEDYTIPAYIDVRVGGAIPQKSVRDQALAVFATFWGLFTADLSLGGVCVGGKAQIGSVTSVPANLGSVAEPGRRHFIGFGVRCTGLHV